eukprot:3019806-Rhodomonas_salina.5
MFHRVAHTALQLLPPVFALAPPPRPAPSPPLPALLLASRTSFPSPDTIMTPQGPSQRLSGFSERPILNLQSGLVCNAVQGCHASDPRSARVMLCQW